MPEPEPKQKLSAAQIEQLVAAGILTPAQVSMLDEKGFAPTRVGPRGSATAGADEKRRKIVETVAGFASPFADVAGSAFIFIPSRFNTQQSIF